MAVETELALGDAMKIIAKPARSAVLVVICTGAIICGSYWGWQAVSEQTAKAIEVRAGPCEARLTALENHREQMQADLGEIKNSVGRIQQEIEDRLPLKK